MSDRPGFIGHWRNLEAEDDLHYPGDTELQSIDASIGQELGLVRIGVHHQRLLPGRRTSYPHAESAEEEFVYVVEGNPDVWIDGCLHKLTAGDGVAFPAGTGICHTFINNTSDEVRLLVIGERPKAENRVHYPLDPDYERTRDDAWVDIDPRSLGEHDGMPHP